MTTPAEDAARYSAQGTDLVLSQASYLHERISKSFVLRGSRLRRHYTATIHGTEIKVNKVAIFDLGTAATRLREDRTLGREGGLAMRITLANKEEIATCCGSKTVSIYAIQIICPGVEPLTLSSEDSPVFAAAVDPLFKALNEGDTLVLHFRNFLS